MANGLTSEEEIGKKRVKSYKGRVTWESFRNKHPMYLPSPYAQHDKIELI